jgi:predicted metal-binding membrane protein
MTSEVNEPLLRRDRIVVLSGLALIVALAWAYVASLASDMRNMETATEMAMSQMQEVWGIMDFALTFVMWAVMMVAMMTPSAAPMILMFAGINRRRRDQQPTPQVST